MAETLLLGDTTTQVGFLTLDVGIASLAVRLRRDPPSEADLEAGIDMVEEAIGSPPIHFAGATLQGEGPWLEPLARAAGIDGNAPLSAEAVEGLFTRLAQAAAGALRAADALPPGREFAAALLLLRELMHHLRIGGISRP